MTQPVSSNNLYSSIRQLIDERKQQLAVAVNATMSMLYCDIGKRINEEVEQFTTNNISGKKSFVSFCRQLEAEYGASFAEKNLLRMMQFAETFPDEEIVVSLIRQLSWTHILAIIPMTNPLQREFYMEMCKLEKWGVRTFRERIKSMLYERTAISKKPEEIIANDLQSLKKDQQLSPELVFRYPYFLDFLGLKDAYSEKELEASIIVELQKFIIEMGSDFAFMARQKRITIDNKDYYIDHLFYHRRLKCVVVIDLKFGEFDAAFKGQMELYLRYLQKHEQMEGENMPIGLILCSGKSEEHIELLQLDQANIKVAEYLTLLPSQEILKAKLQQAIEIATMKNIQND